MKRLEFNVKINAPKKKVWDVMLQPKTYKEWAGASWPDSQYEGSWEKGKNIKFFSPGQGGTMATITENIPNETVFAKHVAILNADGSEDRTSDSAKGWDGTTESYRFTE